MNRRHDESKSENRTRGARAGTGRSQPSADQTDLVKRNLERFRETVKGTNKTALLWVAALAIVWLTGLERINRDVTDTFDAIQRSNRNKQTYLETRVKKDFESSQNVELRSSKETLENIEQTLNELSEKNAQAVKVLDAARLRAVQEPENPTVKSSVADAEASLKHLNERINDWKLRREDNEHAKRIREQSEKSIDDQRKSIESQRESLGKKQQELRAKKEGVSFDILSQKFEVSPLYAPISWSLFLIGLMFYLLRARSSLLTLCVKTIGIIRTTKKSSSASTLTDIFTEAPWWLAPLPNSPRSAYSVEQKKREGLLAAGGTVSVSKSPDQGGSGTQILAEQLKKALGWHHGGLVAGLMATTFIFLLVLAQMRVIWLGLEMSRQLGSNHQRLLVMLGLSAVALMIIFVVRRWFVQENLSAAEGSSPGAFPVFEAVGAVLLVGALITLSLLLWNRPKIVNVARSAFEGSLFWLAIAVLIGLVASCVFESIKFILKRNKESLNDRTEGIDRRQFLLGAIGYIGVLGVIRALPQRDKTAHPRIAPRFIHSDKQCRNKRKTASALAHGFYVNSKSKIIHYISIGGVIGGLSDCGRFRLDHLTPFAALPLPERKPSGRNNWQSTSSVDKDVLVVEPPPQSASKPVRKASRKDRLAPVSASPAASVRPGASNSATTSVMNLLKVELKRDDIKQQARSMPIRADGKRQRPRITRNPRVHLSNASVAFENAVIFILAGKDLRANDYETACRLLVYAINHDLRLSADTGHLPSFRLYDLLAGLSLRYDRSEYSVELLRLVKELGLEPLFQSRIKKWGDPNSSWHQRWNNQERPLKWGGKLGISLASRRSFR